MSQLIIDGVNCDNHHLLNIVAGNYGYLGLVRVVNECCYSIALWEELLLDRIANDKMEAEYITLGFSVSRTGGEVNTGVGFSHMY